MSQKSKFHVFVEFSLHIFSMILKIRCFDPENGDDIAKLDPFVPVVLQCLELKYERVFNFSFFGEMLDYTISFFFIFVIIKR